MSFWPEDRFLDPEADASEYRYDASDADKVAAAVTSARTGWNVCTDAIELPGPLRWKPHLLSSSGDIGHVHLEGSIGDVWARRIKAARASGRGVEILAPGEAWLDEDLLAFADEVGAKPTIVSRDDGWNLDTFRSVGQFVAKKGLRLSPETFRVIGLRGLERALEASGSTAKGRTFEDFLSVFFNQVSYFRVLGTNITNATEEIDVYLENTRDGEWVSVRSPFIVVTAKNERQPIGVQVLTYLLGQMEMRRDTCQIGFLCAARKIAGTVPRLYEKGAKGRGLVVMLDGATLRDLVTNGLDLDRRVRDFVWRASTK